MKKVGLLISHLFLTYILVTFFGLIFWVGGPYGLLYGYGNVVLLPASALLMFLATFLSAKFLSKSMAFTKDFIPFVLFISLIFGLLLIWGGYDSLVGKDTAGAAVNLFSLAVYLVTTYFF